MPRIAYITSTFPDYKSCGTGIYAGYLTAALSHQGHDVHIITSAIPEIKASLGRLTIHKVLKKWNVLEVPVLIQTLVKIRPDIIHINHPTAIAAQRWSFMINFFPQINKIIGQVPLVVTLHEFNKVSLLGKLKILPMCSAADAITVTNQRYRENLLRHLPNHQHSRIHVVNIGSQFRSDLPWGDRSEQRKRWDLAPDDEVLGFVGFITPPKGFNNLISAVSPLVRKHPRLKILALSSWNLSTSAYRQKILDLIDREGLTGKIIFTGFLDDDDLWSALSAVDVCVFPFEYPVEERSSGPLRQVLDRGLPTIVFAESRDYSEFGLRHKKNIWFSQYKDIRALSDDIETVLGDTNIKETLSKGALALKSELSFDSVSNAMSRLYSQLLTRPN